MSFLPYAAPASGTWIGSLGCSAVAHAGIVSVLVFGYADALAPRFDPYEPAQSDVAVSLQILEAEPIADTEALELETIPEDALELAPDDMEAARFVDDDAGALTPEDDATPPETPEAVLPEPEPEAAPLEPAVAQTPEPVTPETPEPETPEPVAPETLEPVTPETPQPVEPVTAEAPEPLEPVTAQIPDPVAPDPVAPDPVPADPIALAPITPEINAPALPAQEALTPSAPQVAAPLIDPAPAPGDVIINPLAEGGGLSPAAPEVGDAEAPALLDLGLTAPAALAPSTPAQIASLPETPSEILVDPGATDGTVLPTDDTSLRPEVLDTGPVDTLAVLDDPLAPEDSTDPAIAPESVEEAAPGRPTLANPSQTDIALGALIRRIRAVPHPACTLALPRRAGGAPGGGVSLFGADESAVETLAARILQDAPAIPPIQTRETLDPRQCALLDALRQTADYPVSRVGLAFESTQLVSGDTMRVRVIGAGGLFLTVLVVDDNGVVQDVAPFTTLDGLIPVIEVPVARAGPTRATRQLLLALASRDAPLDLSAVIGALAQDVFTAIPSDQRVALSFALAAFDVR